MDMMKTVDGGVHECDESDDVARGVLGRLENMLLLPGTLHFGSAIHADTFFIDCGADDVFMDAELADRLNIPLVKIPVPIKLRLADGDSSSMITHRTLPLSCILVDMLKQLVSMYQSLPWDYSWVFLAGDAQPTSQLGVQNGGFWIQLLFGKLLRWVDSDSRTWKASKYLGYLAQALASRNKNHPTRLLILPWIRILISVYSKTSSMDLDLGSQTTSTSEFQQHFEIGLIRRNHSNRSYPFLEASPVSETPIPLEISEEFSSVFSELQAEILPAHRSFRLHYKPIIFCRTVIRKDLPVDSRRR
ncbi:hypothetical protein BASA83_013018 [Batrachochytrium salamandrivorans]|nr:hypothetical protein BASA83_013018 [Batrachochytrium salamandrivorans]